MPRRQGTLKQYFSKTILTCGYDYVPSGYIGELAEINESSWQAEVKGSSLYIVDIMLNEQREPSYMECDCPYERNFKHSAAVLYAIREELKKPET